MTSHKIILQPSKKQWGDRYFGVALAMPHEAIDKFLFDFVNLTNIWGEYCTGFKDDISRSRLDPNYVIEGQSETHYYKMSMGCIYIEDFLYPDHGFTISIQDMETFMLSFESCKVSGSVATCELDSLRAAHSR